MKAQETLEVAPHADVVNRAARYRMLASFFLDLPQREMLECMAKVVRGDDCAFGGLGELRSFFSEASLEDEDLLNAIGVDRTFLVRGVTVQGPRPPYGALYANQASESSMLRLKALYRRAGFRLSSGACESPDYLGVELAFVATLLEKASKVEKEKADELVALSSEFIRDVLIPFGCEYASEALNWARTRFCRGMLMLTKEFLECEAEFVTE